MRIYNLKKIAKFIVALLFANTFIVLKSQELSTTTKKYPIEEKTIRQLLNDLNQGNITSEGLVKIYLKQL